MDAANISSIPTSLKSVFDGPIPEPPKKASFAGMRAPFVNPTVLSCNRYAGCQIDFENAIMNLIAGMTSGRSGNFLDEAFETPRIATHDTDPIATRQAMTAICAQRI